MAKKKKSDTITMSIPEGMEFNTSYSLKDLQKQENAVIDSAHSKYYYDFDRNKGNSISFAEKLDLEIKIIADLLKEKNAAYGNTALNPTNVFSKLNATEAICARIDDKLARISNRGINDETEDTVDDLIGYLLLLKMSMK